MQDPFHLARQHVSRLTSPALSIAAATHVLRAFCAEQGLVEAEVAVSLAGVAGSGRRTEFCNALATLADAAQWFLEKPTAPGSYLWRKNYQWEPVEREVRLIDGVLKTYAHRVCNWVALSYLDAGGSEWFRGVAKPTRETVKPKLVEAGVCVGGGR